MLRSEQELFLKELRKNTEGWVARYLNKPVSFAITRRLMATSVTPNQITGGNLLLAILASWLLASDFYSLRILAALLMQFSSILDGCDGEVARLKNLCSKRGAWFDTLSDDITNILFFTGIFLGLRHQTDGMALHFFGWETIMASIGVAAIIYHYLITVSHSANAAHFRLAWQSPKADVAEGNGFYDRFLKPVMKRDFFIFFMAVMVILDQRESCFWVAVVATNITFGLYLTSFVYKMTLDSPRNKGLSGG